MGCASSNLDYLPAVTLCRDRRRLLDEAIKLRFALAEAHFAYIHSLKEIGGSLRRFIDRLDSSGSGSSADDRYSGISEKRGQDPGEASFTRINFMMSKAPRPNSAKVLYADESSSSSSHYPYPFPNLGYPSNDYSSGGGAVNHFHVSSLSPWDFLDPFWGYDHYYAPPPMREEKSDHPPEMLQEVQNDLKFVETSLSKPTIDEDQSMVSVGGGRNATAALFQNTPASILWGGEGREYEVDVVGKKVMNTDENAVAAKARRRGQEAAALGEELETLFVRASQSGSEVAKMLEIGKLPYKRKHVLKILDVVQSFKIPESEDEEMAMKSGSLSFTLQKLYLWEKKLYKEVKTEEKLRTVHERKLNQLKRLEAWGAETKKLEWLRSLIRKLSARTSISIQVIAQTSSIISKIRDEELWPQLNELMQGLGRMWKRMLECHRRQLRAIRGTRELYHISSGKKLHDLEAAWCLSHELIHWAVRFSDWIDCQKGFVKALNNWLLKCLVYEPEATPDGTMPFSPSKIGAPTIFILCNRWSRTIGKLSKKRVADSLFELALIMFRVWEQDKAALRERTPGNEDIQRKVKALNRDDEKMRKKLRALKKKTGRFGCDNSGVMDGDFNLSGDFSLNDCLERVLKAMESFTVHHVNAYEELVLRSREEKEEEEEHRGMPRERGGPS